MSVASFKAEDVVREDLVAAIVSAYDARQRRVSDPSI